MVDVIDEVGHVLATWPTSAAAEAHIERELRRNNWAWLHATVSGDLACSH